MHSWLEFRRRSHFLSARLVVLTANNLLKVIMTVKYFLHSILRNHFCKVERNILRKKPLRITAQMCVNCQENLLSRPSGIQANHAHCTSLHKETEHSIKIFETQEFRNDLYTRLFFGHFEKNSRPKKLKPKKNSSKISKNSSKSFKNSIICQLKTDYLLK